MRDQRRDLRRKAETARAGIERATRSLRDARGQSIVEVALVLPIALLLFAGALDMGRLFFARVSIENAAREGAVFAIGNPRCDTSAQTGCTDPNTAEWRTKNEARSLDGLVTTFTCFDGSTARGSVADCEAGDEYLVTVEDEFDFLTPLLTPIFGSSMTLEASATSFVLNSASDPTATFKPWPTAVPPTATPPGADCTVKDWVGDKANAAESEWVAAGFSAANFNRVGNGNFNISFQDLPAGDEPCDSSITVYQNVP